MSSEITPPAQGSDVHEIGAADLPLSCPGPHTPVWNLHPKVFLDIATTGFARCPYCSAEYRLRPGEHVGAH